MCLGFVIRTVLVLLIVISYIAPLFLTDITYLTPTTWDNSSCERGGIHVVMTVLLRAIVALQSESLKHTWTK